MERIYFSINEYDSDGDISEKGVYLHFDNTRVLVSDSIEEFTSKFPKLINDMIKEILENY